MKKRIEKWDVLKFGLIFLVVLGHICDQYVKQSEAVRAIWICIYSFHMPLFFFVSGLFSKRKVNEKQYTKIFSYFALYIVAQMALLLAKIFFAGNYELQLLDTRDTPWFIFVLFWYYLITIALKSFDKKYILTGTVILACMAGYDDTIADMMQLSRLIVFYPFFYLGYCVEEESVRKALSNRFLKIVSVVVLGIAVAVVYNKIESVCWIRPLLTGRNPFSKLNSVYYCAGGLLRLCYYIVSVLVGAMVIAITPEHLWKAARWGSRSIQVYILHRPCIILFCSRLHVENWLAQMWPSHYYVFIIPMALLITIFCSWKIFEKPIRIMTEPTMISDRSKR